MEIQLKMIDVHGQEEESQAPASQSRPLSKKRSRNDLAAGAFDYIITLDERLVDPINFVNFLPDDFPEYIDSVDLFNRYSTETQIDPLNDQYVILI